MKAFLCLATAGVLFFAPTVQAEEAAPPAPPVWDLTQAQVDLALRYARESKFDLAFPIFSKLAEAGNLDAQYHLGIMYYHGEGMPPDHKKAFAWRMRAAKSGHAAAQFEFGTMYFHGEGTKADRKEAVRWFRASAEQGYPIGQRNLALSYLEGKGVPKNIPLAIQWFKAAGEKGDERSFRILAEMYDRGEGVKRDQKEAFRWYGRSAINGDYLAQLELAKRYFDGRGTERDIVKARMWARILGGNGPAGSLISFSGGQVSVGENSTSIRVPARQLAEKAEKMMSPAQIEQADALRKTCEDEDTARRMAACGLE